MRWLALIPILLLNYGAALGQAPALEVGTPPIPSLSLSNSPVAQFRHWLALDSKERDAALADRNANQREVLKGKLHEYDLLPVAEREQKLRAVEFHWLTKTLLTLPAEARKTTLAAAPDAWRPLLGDRLAQWDRLPGELQKEMLESEMVVTSFVRLAQAGTEAQQAWLRGFKPSEQPQIRERFERWQKMPATERQRLSTRFHQFFDLPAREQQKSLDTLSDAERQQMEATLRAFSRLPIAQRRVCIDSFGKFASMSAEERRQFLRNAEVWKSMSPRDRATWRHLVQNLPPMPVVAEAPPIPGAPKPPSSRGTFTASNELTAPLTVH